MLEHPDGIDTMLLESLGLCERLTTQLAEELEHVDNTIRVRLSDNPVIERLQTIPGVGPLVSYCQKLWINVAGGQDQAASS